MKRFLIIYLLNFITAWTSNSIAAKSILCHVWRASFPPHKSIQNYKGRYKIKIFMTQQFFLLMVVSFFMLPMRAIIAVMTKVLESNRHIVALYYMSLSLHTWVWYCSSYDLMVGLEYNNFATIISYQDNSWHKSLNTNS